MVSKINDPTTLTQVSAFSSPGALPGQLTSSASQTAAAAQPAATIGLSKTVQTAKTDLVGDNFDTKLVAEIRDRLAKGTFQIDYTQVAGQLLRHAVSAVRSSGR